MSESDDWGFLKEEDFPESVKQVVKIIGYEDTIELLKVLPLQGVYIPKNPEAIKNHLIGQTIPIEKAQQLALFFGGETVELPTKLALTKAKIRRIRTLAAQDIDRAKSKTEYYAQVAIREKLSISRVREIINNNCRNST